MQVPCRLDELVRHYRPTGEQSNFGVRHQRLEFNRGRKKPHLAWMLAKSERELTEI
jgi:hypothetical protein